MKRLTNGGEKMWRAVAMETDVEGVTAEGRWIRLNIDETLSMNEGDREIKARWELSDDASEIAVSNRIAGEWHPRDTLWMEIVHLSNDSMTLEYRNSFGLLRVHYTAEGNGELADTAGFGAFYERFKAAVARRDKKAVAAMTHFPFGSYDLPSIAGVPRHDPSFTRQEFLRYYDRLFNKSTRHLIAVSKPTLMHADDDEITSMAVGIRREAHSTIWIEFYRFDDGSWSLVRTDNVSWSDDDD